MKTKQIKLLIEWSDYAQGTILQPAVAVADTLIAEGYAVAVKGKRRVETATAPPAPEDAMDALKVGSRRGKRGKR